MSVESTTRRPSPPVDLTGQVGLVTGGSAGLGRRFATTLVDAGADVIIAGRRQPRLDDAVNEIEGGRHAGSGHCASILLDVSRADEIAAAVDSAEGHFGPIDILVNNAGVPDAMRAHKMPLELINLVIDTNLRGPFVLACEVGRRLIAAQRSGRIVNIASMSAFDYDGTAAATLYSTTKAAVNRMTEALAVEWARYNINVNGIAPGAFSSEMLDGMIGRIGEIHQHFPRTRVGQPEQLDSTLLYLVGPASEAVTGTVIKVDDGQGRR